MPDHRKGMEPKRRHRLARRSRFERQDRTGPGFAGSWELAPPSGAELFATPGRHRWLRSQFRSKEKWLKREKNRTASPPYPNSIAHYLILSRCDKRNCRPVDIWPR